MARKKSKLKSGFVSIIGRPNAGKSTLLNALVGTKLAIVADKPQTTRTTVQGIWTTPEAQVVFLDTPGIHKADSLINKRMMHEVRNALDERDLLLYLVDATRRIDAEDDHALDLLRKAETPAFLVVNKIDRVKPKNNLLPVLEAWKAKFDFKAYLPISALKGEGVDELRAAIVEALPKGPAYFPADQVTDQPERFLAAELIREKILHETRQEVPHSVAVFVDVWEEEEDADPHHGDDLCGAGRAEGDRHRLKGNGAQEHWHPRTPGHRDDARPQGVSGTVRENSRKLAGKPAIPERARLADVDGGNFD